MGQILDAARIIVSGRYMGALSQYRGVGRGIVEEPTLVSSAVGNSPADPPGTFTDDDITNLLSNLIYRGMVPSPDDPQLLNVVMLPPDSQAVGNPGNGMHGHYTYYAFPLYWANVRFGWVLNPRRLLDDVTTSCPTRSLRPARIRTMTGSS